jgi:transposase
MESCRCGDDAGPTGFGPTRRLHVAGFVCQAKAPSLIPVQPGSRVKTDRRDARKTAPCLRSWDRTAVHVLDPCTEALRDPGRARDDAKRAGRSARHPLSQSHLRHGRRFEGKN